jgi:hypothetical protein
MATAWQPSDAQPLAVPGDYWMLPDTSAQQAVVRRYLDLLSEERYADAWELLTPE